jgi:hypothetical protein
VIALCVRPQLGGERTMGEPIDLDPERLTAEAPAGRPVRAHQREDGPPRLGPRVRPSAWGAPADGGALAGRRASCERQMGVGAARAGGDREGGAGADVDVGVDAVVVAGADVGVVVAGVGGVHDRTGGVEVLEGAL